MSCVLRFCPSCLSKLSVPQYLCIHETVHPTMLCRNSWLLEHFTIWKAEQVLREAREISPHPLTDWMIWMEMTDWIDVSHEAGPDAAHNIGSVSRHWILFSYYFSPFPNLHFLFSTNFRSFFYYRYILDFSLLLSRIIDFKNNQKHMC